MKYTPVDIETEGLSFLKHRILGIGVGCIYSTNNLSLPSDLQAVAHNGRFEYKHLKQAGIPFNWAFDTLLAASVLVDRPEKLTLDSVAEYYLGTTSWKGETNKLFKKKNWVQLLEASPDLQKELADRNVADLKATGELAPVLEQKLRDEGMHDFFFKKLMPAARLMAEVEYTGMRIDVPATRQKLADINQQIADLIVKLNTWVGTEVNWNSPKQVLGVLKSKGYNIWWYDFKKKATVESSCSDSISRLLPNDNIQLLLDYRGATKLHGYLEGWLEEQVDGRLYASFNLASTRTGRLSSSAPNLQQIPRDKEIRSLFIPSEGKVFVIADQAQIEPRVAAHYTEDVALLDVFKSNLDFYGSIATRVLGVNCAPNDVKKLFPKERQLAKVIGLSILYGIGANKLGTLIQKGAGLKLSESECKNIIKEYFKAYPNLLEFRKYVERKVMAGEVLKTHYGRQFLIDPAKVFSTAVNTLVQSTASDAVLFSQLEVAEKLKEAGIKAQLIALVHDECIYECDASDAPKLGAILEDCMTNQGFLCPLKLDWAIASSWGGKG